MRRLLALTSLIVSTGCALMPQPGPRPTVGPPYIPPPEPVWVVIDPALLASATPEPALTRSPRSPAREVGEPAAPGPTVTSPVPDPKERGSLPLGTEGPGPDATRDDADSIHAVAARAALVSIDLGSEDHARLTRAAKRNLAAADSLTRLAGAQLPAPRNPTKLAAAQGLVRQAQEAMQRGDSRAAANLAYKARLLAAEANQQ